MIIESIFRYIIYTFSKSKTFMSYSFSDFIFRFVLIFIKCYYFIRRYRVVFYLYGIYSAIFFIYYIIFIDSFYIFN